MNPMMLKGARCCTDHHAERSRFAIASGKPCQLGPGSSPRSTEPSQVAGSQEDVAAPEQAGSCDIPGHGACSLGGMRLTAATQTVKRGRDAVWQPQTRALSRACLQRVVGVCNGHLWLLAPHHIHTQLHTSP